MKTTCAKGRRTPFGAGALLMLLMMVGCGDDSSDAERDAASGVEPRDASQSDSAIDSGLESSCPASGDPAIDGCPCDVERGNYCCEVGRGMECLETGVWQQFWDGPCWSGRDEDGGVIPANEPFIDVINCR